MLSSSAFSRRCRRRVRRAPRIRARMPTTRCGHDALSTVRHGFRQQRRCLTNPPQARQSSYLFSIGDTTQSTSDREASRRRRGHRSTCASCVSVIAQFIGGGTACRDPGSRPSYGPGPICFTCQRNPHLWQDTILNQSFVRHRMPRVFVQCCDS